MPPQLMQVGPQWLSSSPWQAPEQIVSPAGQPHVPLLQV
jgi:hypothetical protein